MKTFFRIRISVSLSAPTETSSAVDVIVPLPSVTGSPCLRLLTGTLFGSPPESVLPEETFFGVSETCLFSRSGLTFRFRASS